MTKVIIFQNDEGGVSIMTPFTGSGLTVEEIAQKDVPDGKAYRVVDESEIPEDRSTRDSWTLDENLNIITG